MHTPNSTHVYACIYPYIGMIRGPVKRPDRALQKAHRKYFMDPRCLTDLVRGCVLLGSLEDVDHCLEVILGMSVIGSLGTRWEEVPASCTPDAGKEIKNQALADLLAEKPAWTITREELEGSNAAQDVGSQSFITLANGKKLRPAVASDRIFRLVKVKDRFTSDQEDGYRDICLNLEVAWTISSESDEALDFLPVYDSQGRSWDAMPHIRTHICEVQLLLESMYTLKATGCHDNFVAARNFLAQ